MTDDLEVRIERLLAAREQWLEDANTITAPLYDWAWNPYGLTTSPAMPGGLKLLIEDVKTATTQLRQSLRDGGASCRNAAEAVGWAAGMYQAQEDEGAELASGIGSGTGARPV